jgi:hypothetical protein
MAPVWPLWEVGKNKTNSPPGITKNANGNPLVAYKIWRQKSSQVINFIGPKREDAEFLTGVNFHAENITP